MADRERVTLNIPVRPRHYASLTVSKPMTVAEWDQMMKVLAAMRPGLVDEPAGGPDDSGWPR